MQPDFWQTRYLANRMPWDMRGVPTVLLDYLHHRKDTGRVLIPGCGSGYEVRAFRQFGWNTVAIDFAAAAVERARAVLGTDASVVRVADFFTDHLGDPFDLIYDRAFLCALPSERWADYARHVAELTRPGGCLVGIFAYREPAKPTSAPALPPFPLTRATARELLGGQFLLAEDCAIPPEQSLPVFAGMERWQVWRRKTMPAVRRATTVPASPRPTR